MCEVVALKPTLSDSTFKTRPNFKSYIQTDQNAGLDDVQLTQAKRKAKLMKFPSMLGTKTPNSLSQPLSDQGFVKWNDTGDHHSTAPSRYYNNIIDPVSGFISAGGDVHRNTGVKKLKNFVHVSDTPQDCNPRLRNSIRMSDSAPSDLRRLSKDAPPVSTYWNSRKTLDISTRAKLGGWTSDQDPRKTAQGDLKNEVRDQLALQYMYKSTTEQQYQDVPWDNMLPPKQWAPVSTLEPKPDQVDQRYTLRRYANDAHEYQHIGRSWDWFQTRNGYYKNPQWISFTSPSPRKHQIPLYGGCVGADNLDEIDNQHVPFQPYTVKRVNIPVESETSHRPNIPGYAGSTLYQRQTATEIPKTATEQKTTSTGAVHQPMPPASAPAAHKRDAVMSKMVTLVPPFNPFNKRNLMPEKLDVK